MQQVEHKDLGAVAQDAWVRARDEWCRQSHPRLEPEEVWASKVAQAQQILIERPGGRLTSHIVITPKRRSQGEEHFYNRYQLMPGVGYVQVYTRNGM